MDKSRSTPGPTDYSTDIRTLSKTVLKSGPRASIPRADRDVDMIKCKYIYLFNIDLLIVK